jgi:hypothetical protein
MYLRKVMIDDRMDVSIVSLIPIVRVAFQMPPRSLCLKLCRSFGFFGSSVRAS